MEFETFRKIPFERFKYAHLQGWGEPLLNQHIGEMIELAGKSCRVGLTTNGLLIDEFLNELLKADLVAISIGCAISDVHLKVRKCRLDDIIENVRLLSEREERPKIVLNTLMMRDTIEHLPELIKLAARVGADEVIANNLDYLPSCELSSSIVYSWKERKDVNKPIQHAKTLAKSLGVSFFARPTVLEEALICAENPTRNCLITYKGDVAPCVYLHLPTDSEVVPRCFEGRRVEVKKMYFGNVATEKFDKIWKNESYRMFRQRFEARLRLLTEFLVTSIPELPETCRSCYKAYSI